MGRDKLESLRERRGEKRGKEREGGTEKQSENRPVIEMASGKKRTGKHRGEDRLGIGRWQRKRVKSRGREHGGRKTWM